MALQGDHDVVCGQFFVQMNLKWVVVDGWIDGFVVSHQIPGEITVSLRDKQTSTNFKFFNSCLCLVHWPFRARNNCSVDGTICKLPPQTRPWSKSVRINCGGLTKRTDLCRGRFEMGCLLSAFIFPWVCELMKNTENIKWPARCPLQNAPLFAFWNSIATFFWAFE